MKKKPKRMALGPAPTRDEETRRAIATVTPAREVRAVELWRRSAPAGAAGMIDATPTEKKP